MATTKTNKSAYTGNVLRDGYTLVQSFTTGGTAQSLQTTPISPTTLAGLSGVTAFGGGDGVRFIFVKTASATSTTYHVVEYEPVFASGGTIGCYIERTVSSHSGDTITSWGSTVTAGTVLNGVISSIPSTAVFALTIPHAAGQRAGGASATTSPLTGYVYSYDPSNERIAHLDYTPAQGATHFRVLLSCATASESVFCLARRLQGNSQSLTQG